MNLLNHETRDIWSKIVPYLNTEDRLQAKQTARRIDHHSACGGSIYIHSASMTIALTQTSHLASGTKVFACLQRLMSLRLPRMMWLCSFLLPEMMRGWSFLLPRMMWGVCLSLAPDVLAAAQCVGSWRVILKKRPGSGPGGSPSPW